MASTRLQLISTPWELFCLSLLANGFISAGGSLYNATRLGQERIEIARVTLQQLLPPPAGSDRQVLPLQLHPPQLLLQQQPAVPRHLQVPTMPSC